MAKKNKQKTGYLEEMEADGLEARLGTIKLPQGALPTMADD